MFEIIKNMERKNSITKRQKGKGKKDPNIVELQVLYGNTVKTITSLNNVT